MWACGGTPTGTGSGTRQNLHRFKTGIQNHAIDLMKFGLRWYDAVVGTRTQQDALDAPNGPCNANRYEFGSGDLRNGSDSTG